MEQHNGEDIFAKNIAFFKEKTAFDLSLAHAYKMGVHTLNLLVYVMSARDMIISCRQIS